MFSEKKLHFRVKCFYFDIQLYLLIVNYKHTPTPPIENVIMTTFLTSLRLMRNSLELLGTHQTGPGPGTGRDIENAGAV